MLEDGSAFDPTNGKTQIIVMPAKNITLTGTHTGLYNVTMINGSVYDPSGQYYTSSTRLAGGTVTNIRPRNIPIGQEFFKWECDVDCLKDPYEAETELTMPAQAIQITATFKTLEPILTVINGETSGMYNIGDVVPIYSTLPKDDPRVRSFYWMGMDTK